MDVIALIQTANPDITGNINNLRDPGHAKAMEKIQEQYKGSFHVTLEDLIRHAKKSDTPSLRLQNDVRDRLIERIGHRCRQPVIQHMESRFSLSLSLVPHFLWAKDIHFYQKRVVYVGSRSIRLIRQDIQGS